VKLERGRYNRKRRQFRNSGSNLVPLILSPRRELAEQFYSQEDLFSDQSSEMEGSAPMPPLLPVPAQLTPAQLFDRTLKLANVNEFNQLILQNQALFNPNEFVDNIRYQGFERDSFILSAAQRITASQMLRLAIIGAIRGANFDKIMRSSLKVDEDLKQLATAGTIKRKAVGSTDITVLRCTAAIPQWAAYFMGKAGVAKKIGNLDCPAALQFPGAASLPMSKEVRLQHVKFSIHFSKLIKGEFNENIYMTMMQNIIPAGQIPDELRLVLGTYDQNVDVTPSIEAYKKEIGTAVVKA
jgi:hypothetical protein